MSTRRPVATSNFSPVTVRPSSSVIVNSLPSCATCRRVHAGGDRHAVALERLAGPGRRTRAPPSTRIRSAPSITVTATPKRAKTWVSSTPIAPPPSTTSEAGSVSTRIASWFVQNGVPARPSIGGTSGTVPVATTMPFDASNSRSPTSTVFGPVIVACSRTNVTPFFDQAVDRDLVVPVVGRLVADPLRHRSPVGLDRRRTGHAVDPARLGDQVGGADHHLARDAPVVRALAADQPRLDARPRSVRLRRAVRPPPRRLRPARSRPRQPVQPCRQISQMAVRQPSQASARHQAVRRVLRYSPGATPYSRLKALARANSVP